MQNKENKESCFIITPIGDDLAPIRRHIDGIIDAVIEPALGDKYKIVVAHRISEPGSITKQIIREIYTSKLVIANLTDRNPNVMYELAFRHSLGKPVIMIAEKGTPLPSDIIMERTIFYQNDAKGVLELRKCIQKAEEDIDFSKENSPLHDVLREINDEIEIVKTLEEGSSAESKNKNSNTLEYILEKLTKIEDMMPTSRYNGRWSELNTRLLNEISSEYMTVNFRYQEKPEEYDKGNLIKKLRMFSSLCNGKVDIVGVSESKTSKEVSIVVKVHDSSCINAMVGHFYITLEKSGFSELELASVTKN